MLDFLRKFFQQEGAESGKTLLEEDEKTLLENNAGTDTEDKTNVEVINQDSELKSGNDLSFEDLERNEKIIRSRITNGSEQGEKKPDEDKTEQEENLLYNPDGEQENNSSDKNSTSDKTNAPMKITKEYIATQPEENREFLQRIFDETITPKALKSWLHSQAYIEGLKSNKSITEKQPVQQQGNADIISTEEVKAERKSFLLKGLKTSYPDITEDIFEDEDSLDEYVADLKMHSPVRAEKFVRTYLEAEGEWNKTFQHISAIANNWETNAKANVVSAVQEFDNGLKDLGVSSKDLGIKYTEQFILDTFIMPNGKPNPKIVSYLDKSGRIPVVDRDALVTAMEKHYKAAIVDAVRSSVAKEVYSGRERREADPGISTSGVRRRIDRPEPVSKLITEDMSLEEMEKVLANNKKNILQTK
jgi:hypothetical protein